MQTWNAHDDTTERVESPPASSRRARAPSPLAAALLALSDPVPTLRRWIEETPRPALARALHAVVEELDRGERRSPLAVRHVDQRVGGHAIRLDLLLLPSIFVPEAWSLTFLEGLLQKPLRAYAGKRLIELGTGSGWIALALLCVTRLERVLGLDLNPEAVLMARLNAVLNGHDRTGAPLPNRLAERFEARVSDLLETELGAGPCADLVIGCIPQVIAPSGDLASAEGPLALGELGNYCVAQGLVEDDLGLGLNARALREALSVLSPGGSVILNLAGRPGYEALREMFERRGFTPEPLRRSRIEQAADTSIAPLAELEVRHGHSFAFYLDSEAGGPVSAALALAARRADRPIFHDLHVIEGKPRSASPDDGARFAARLARGWKDAPRAPYPHEAGDVGFRARIARLLGEAHGLALSPAEIFAAPGRAHLIDSLLACLVAPGDEVISSASLRVLHGPLLTRCGAVPLWVSGGDELAELLARRAPRLVLLAPDVALGAGDEALSGLLRRCEALGALLVLDVAEDLEIAGTEGSALFAFLARHQGSASLALLFGLARPRALADVDLALLVSRHARLMTGLAAVAEVTYSRLSCFHQAYHEARLDELPGPPARAGGPDAAAPPLESPGPPVRPLLEAILRSPAFVRPEPAPGVIRLDYGENELPMPGRLAAGVLEGFLRSASAWPRPEARRAACEYLRATRLPRVEERQILLGQGVLPLLFDALAVLRARLGRRPRVLLPRGSFGMILPLLAAAGCEASVLASAAPDFLATVADVDAAADFDVLLLTHPANPSGAAYPPDVLRALIQRCAARSARVILDEVFGMLADLDGPVPLGQDRLSGLNGAEAERVLVLTGASKEFAAGGLRLGLAATLDAGWLADLGAVQKAPLPLHVQVAAERLFSGFAEHRGGLDAMRRRLGLRRDRLARGLAALGFGVDPRGRGGLSLLVDVSPLCAGDPEGFVLDLETRARVRLGTPSWSGLDTHARACFAISEERIDEALARLGRALRR